jgi:hypothetical protein
MFRRRPDQVSTLTLLRAADRGRRCGGVRAGIGCNGLVNAAINAPYLTRASNWPTKGPSCLVPPTEHTFYVLGTDMPKRSLSQLFRQTAQLRQIFLTLSPIKSISLKHPCGLGNISHTEVPAPWEWSHRSPRRRCNGTAAHAGAKNDTSLP